MLSPQEIKELKQQLTDQIKHLPEDKRKQAQHEIDNLSEEALEEMLEEQRSKPAANKSPLRMIIDHQIPAHTIIETKNASVVLDIRPISKGHAIIIPKAPIHDATVIPSTLFSLAKRIALKIKSKLKAKSVEIQTESKFGEYIINAIPIYDKPLSLNSHRYEASKQELESVQQELAISTRKRSTKPKQTPLPQAAPTKTLPMLKRRIA